MSPTYCIIIYYTYYIIDVFDDFIEVFEVLVSIFVLEVWAHGHHDVIGRVILSLLLRSLHKVFDTIFHVVIFQPGVILWKIPKIWVV